MRTILGLTYNKVWSHIFCFRQCSQLTHGEQWIEKSLKDKNISRQIVILLSDSNHLKDHYFGKLCEIHVFGYTLCEILVIVIMLYAIM